jgi:hypothetical protein
MAFSVCECVMGVLARLRAAFVEGGPDVKVVRRMPLYVRVSLLISIAHTHIHTHTHITHVLGP